MATRLPLDELPLVMARNHGILLTGEKTQEGIQLLASAAATSFPGSIGASLCLMDVAGHRTGSTDAVVASVDASQCDLSEGPCTTAWAVSRTIASADIGREPRWPRLAAAAADLDVHAMVVAPLKSGADGR